MEKPEMSATILIFKQNQRRQTPITTMSPLQIRTIHNNPLVQLHQNKHTTNGYGFVDGSRGGGEVHLHITTEQRVFKQIMTSQKLLHYINRTKKSNDR